ncbi:putative nuclease HARBI1 [Rana temporaria]|uniref:putative nuclease HARBI1 n=1 Tax=Rana temporaria TaxID=8407 RepID=UPI001AAC5107|nr:putative nuclease HARBI1 [Rana temporaria]XP_040190193.1 putative nuclease HARBI1 [Rana temporaria]XP_040195785.1 putative nuclease HARBI1 [Rana temporaria]XP_040195786.1 putative nuclease HARBI1 [Rana temporaria]XP_040210459.1 putative nuclease HARBI1 [Rana temporaria]XP_040210460.1 putative nuclease HARBI1 [Rana temporaria]
MEVEDITLTAITAVAAAAVYVAQDRIRNVRRRQPGVFRKRTILDDLSEMDIEEMFRLNRQGVMEVYQLIADDIEPLSARNYAIPAMVRLLAVLNFLATGNFQPSCARLIGISRPSLSRFLKPVLKSIKKHMAKYIHFPATMEEWQELKVGFFRQGGMPNCLGAIDCTHIALIPPHNREEQFRNRKCYHSLNVQVVVDSHQRIMSIRSGFPGSCHDSHILRQSALFDRFEQGNMPEGWLVGDAGYGCRSWLLTPLSNPQTAAEVRYNSVHIRTRSVIERTFGMWKSTFRCLSKTGGFLQHSPELVSDIIIVCAILHNIALASNVDLHINNDLPPEIPALPAASEDSSEQGNLIRQSLIQNYFRTRETGTTH